MHRERVPQGKLTGGPPIAAVTRRSTRDNPTELRFPEVQRGLLSDRRPRGGMFRPDLDDYVIAEAHRFETAKKPATSSGALPTASNSTISGQPQKPCNLVGGSPHGEQLADVRAGSRAILDS